MKNINYLNAFFVGLPIVLALLSFINIEFLYFAMITTALTGFYQVVTGLCLLIDNPTNKLLQLYAVLVITFFILLAVSDNQWLWIWLLPPTLAFFFTGILYKELKNKS
ncbi:hypothetical protein ABGT15_08830 [Flavobacterium enshiense]|uniref:hypothetical protein n=1 Tax=Flavobacterium enshiense TaxID=1341165 RepID=UPI00345D6AF5